MQTSGGIFDYDRKIARRNEIIELLTQESVWQDLDRQRALSKEQAELSSATDEFTAIIKAAEDNYELLTLIADGVPDANSLQELTADLEQLEATVERLSFERMFSGSMDYANAYLDIQAGSGGTEAQDWADMILRMYLKFGEAHSFNVSLLELSPGDIAGIKSATLKFVGKFSYGWLRTESGVHRLVRKSPFDANHKRHTSFASVFVYPEIDDTINIEINPADLRIDTYRAQGAGGQHINKTDSAVRITHNPTGIVVQCQSERSQQQNRLQALKQLRAKLYELELRKQKQQLSALEASKLEISWGSQIRSYVLDDSRIKDLRTGTETHNTQSVLNGDIDLFIHDNLLKNIAN